MANVIMYLANVSESTINIIIFQSLYIFCTLCLSVDGFVARRQTDHLSAFLLLLHLIFLPVNLCFFLAVLF